MHALCIVAIERIEAKLVISNRCSSTVDLGCNDGAAECEKACDRGNDGELRHQHEASNEDRGPRSKSPAGTMTGHATNSARIAPGEIPSRV